MHSAGSIDTGFCFVTTTYIGMAVRRKLTSDVEKWNHPRRAQFGISVAAGAGFLLEILVGATYLSRELASVVLASVCARSEHLLSLVVAVTLD